jgi:two-component system response regulator MprA
MHVRQRGPSDGLQVTAGNDRAPYVLVVDDEPAIRSFLAPLLEMEGFRVCSAADGLEAMAHLASERPDVVLLDLAMPRMDGWQVLRALRDRDDAPPVVVMTAGYDAGHKSEAHNVDCYLRKPFDVDQLLTCLTRALAAESRLTR